MNMIDPPMTGREGVAGTEPAPDAAARLAARTTATSVDYAVAGSVRKSGSRVRVATELIDASTGGIVWADRFESDRDDVFDAQRTRADHDARCH